MKPVHAALILMLATAAGCAATDTAPGEDARVASTPAAESAGNGSDTADGESAPATADGKGSDDSATATSGKAGGGLVFNVRYRVPANQVCSHDRETGSHFEKAHCRSADAAREERDAAQEFLKDRMRKSR